MCAYDLGQLAARTAKNQELGKLCAEPKLVNKCISKKVHQDRLSAVQKMAFENIRTRHNKLASAWSMKSEHVSAYLSRY